MEFGEYITGFTDGEGSFSVSFSRRKKMKTGLEVRPSFSISQHQRNLEILKKIRGYFQVGGIRYSKSDHNYKYEVRSIKDLTDVIIPHFQKYPLKTSKKRDFKLFEKISKLIHSNHHLSSENIMEIIDMAYMMNKSGKRKYAKKELLKFVTR